LHRSREEYSDQWENSRFATFPEKAWRFGENRQISDTEKKKKSKQKARKKRSILGHKAPPPPLRSVPISKPFYEYVGRPK
jgi:hypothetical protein